MRPTYERARDTLRSLGLIRQIVISGLLLTGAAASAEKVLPGARLPETSTVPLVAVLEVDPGCTVAHAVFVETVVYEDGGVVLEGRWPMLWARVRDDGNVVFENTSLPSWARLTPEALEHVRQDVRELLEVSLDRERFGKGGIGVETHEVFVHAGNQFKHVTVMGYPNHGGVEKTDPSSLPRAVVRLLDGTHDPSIRSPPLTSRSVPVVGDAGRVRPIGMRMARSMAAAQERHAEVAQHGNFRGARRARMGSISALRQGMQIAPIRTRVSASGRRRMEFHSRARSVWASV
jgi:hypothetical protein